MPAALNPFAQATRLALIASFVGLCSACPGGQVGPTHPPPEAYGEPAVFAGEWIGEIADVEGALHIDALGPGSYYANFRGDGRPTRYILSMQQAPAAGGPADAPTSNLCTFTWQDGRGGQGSGWVLINREDSALTGTFGRGTDTTGMGVWTFIRIE